REASVADIVFLVDGSWSIGDKNFKSMQDFLYTMVSSFDVGEDKIRVGLIQYSNAPTTEFFLNTYHHKEDILKKIQKLHYQGGGTKTGESLQFMLENHFKETAGSRMEEGVPQIAVMITDGQAQDNIREPARKVKDAGITLYAIGIKDASLEELQEIVSEPADKHVYKVEDFTALQDISHGILQVLCTTVEEVNRQITHVSQVCRKATLADIVFLVDTSTSIGPENFQKVKNFLYTLVSRLDVSSDQVRVGLAQYSDETFKEFLLNQYSLKSDILEQIQNLPYRSGGSYTGSALDFVRTTYFTESAGSRALENVPQIVILVTDGESSDQIKIPANNLKARGISVYVVGINVQDVTELQEIANKPLNKFLFNIDNYDVLQDLPKNLYQFYLRVAPLILIWAPTQESISIQAFTKHYADIVFLVDSSVNVGSSTFEQIKNFIYQIVAQLDVGIDKYRIGLAQYSEGGRVEFLLNTYKSKEDVLKHIQGSVPLLGGPLQTGSALEFLHKVFVKEDAGSRISQGTPQFAVVITSAKSKDDVTQAAENLKDTGVKVISVGVQNSDREELEVIATSPLVYQVSDGQSISQLHQDITGVLETPVQQQYDSALDAKVPAVCASASVADIVFLVDESSRIGLRNFQLTRTFLLKIVNALDIGPNNVRVGLVLYSDEPRLEFTLTTFVNKSDILNYLTKLPYRGGRPYTGAAIDFLRKKVFTQEAGSRKNQGVQQLAVIITDGQSFDDFIEPASKLRRSGVAVYAVGTTNTSTSSQLDKIASYPPRKHVTNLEYFLQLSNIEWKIKKRLCILRRFITIILRGTMSIPLIPGCVDTEEADIYFLIDGSGSIYPNDFQDMKVFMNEMISMFQVSANGVRFGVVQYASTPQTEFTIGQYNSVKQLKEAIRVIQQTGGGTNTGDALRYMKSLFAKAAKDRVPQLLIVITDGESQDEVITPAEELRQEGITIFAIGIKNAVRKELKDIAGAEERMFFVNDYDSLKLIKHDIGHIIDLIQSGCGSRAVSCKNMRADIIFLVDSSESIRPVDFQKMKDFMQLIVNRSDIGADKVQIGLLQFSSDTKEEFQLNRYDSKADLRTAILGMKQIKTGTLTGKALTIASSYFDETKGGRPRVKQYLIVITDGEAQDTVKEPAKAIRDKGVTIFAIGVLQANNSQLMEIASTQDKVFLEDNFDALAFLEKQILFEICNPEDRKLDSSPPTHFQVILTTACKRTEVADIIFVVHGSSSITDLQFQSMKRIMVAVVNDSMVGKDNVQFGAVVYSTDPQDRFTLNTYSAKSQVREAIFNLRPMSGLTFTARALNFARERFGMAYGGRASSLSVTRILVLITDQPTSPLDRPNLPAAAKSLKQDGISVFAVGVDEASRTELEEIVGERERMFFADSYNELESLHPNLTHTPAIISYLSHKQRRQILGLQGALHRPCGKQQADLIFLVDGSGSISARNFSAMKTFMKEIVDNFIIAQDRVQVGVVQFSEEPRKELYLNEFHSDTAIKEQIDSIVQLKTSTYTGKGLRFVKNLFENANGGRKKQLVSQSLVVITDGHSADQVDEAAIALRNDGIHVFAIGIGIPNSYELLRIAGDARRVYVLENFEMLQTIERKIVGEICELEDPPSQAAPPGVPSPENIQEKKLAALMDSAMLVYVLNIDQEIQPPIRVIMLYKAVYRPGLRILINHLASPYSDSLSAKYLPTSQESVPLLFKCLEKVIFHCQKNKCCRSSNSLLEQKLKYNRLFFKVTSNKTQTHLSNAWLSVSVEGKKLLREGENKAHQDELIANQAIASFLIIIAKHIALEPIALLTAGSPTLSPNFGGTNITPYCNIDISVGIDISRRMKPTSAQHMKQKLQNYLPRLLHRMESLTNISCTADSEINIRFKYQVFAQNGQTLFDSDFEAYNEEIIQKFLAEQTTVDTYLNAEFLQSFWEKSLSLASAKVKVLLVFTDGLDDTIEMLQTTADSLRIKGLDALLMVGLENVQDLNELQEIEFGRGFGYKQPLSIGFPELPNILRKELDVIAERKCCNIFAKCIGEPGFHGITGPPGRKGGIGFRGVPGHPGEEGENGERGPMGINGTQGEGGCPGVKGPKGARGYRGIRGHDGENGIDGLDGEEGSQGLPGSSGEKGSTGRQGRKGPRGEVGERGEPGLRGDHGDPGINNNISGPKGEKGKPGQQGEPGTDGVPGELGEEGTDGAEGRRGPQGLKGDQGDRGEPGYPGDPGLPGSQGQRGLQGVRGPPGPQGIPGPQANPGAQGAAGTPGNPGPKGPKGELGDPGEKGPLGPPGPRGMPGLDGDDGSGPAGSKGAKKGETGFPGYPGAQGEDGDPGSRGDRGPKGIRGKRGNAGFPGSEGNPGDQGPPGPQGRALRDQKAPQPCQCVILSFVKSKCMLCVGTIKCPVYPTELVFAFDMSGDVTPVAFERMKNIVISLLRVIQLSESNCPTGARISIVSYNTNTRYLVRFSEFQTSNLLLEAVQRIPLERSSGRRNIGAAMRFIAKNVFKRVRQGALIRKVAIFFANGPSQDATSINTAVLEFSALDITPVVIAFNEVPNVRRAFSVSLSQMGNLNIKCLNYEQQLQGPIRHFLQVHASCLDKCKPDTNCEVTVPPPVMVNMDITYVMDSSRNIDSDEFERAKDFVSAMLDHFVITSQPRDSDEGARVALVQQAPQHFIPNRNMSPVKEEFDLTTYSGKNVMKRHIQKSVHQLEGPSAIGHALQWTIDNIFFQAPEPRQHRVIFTILGSKTSSWDRQKLREISLRAKCQGFIMFTLALGNDITSSELIELSSFPTEQHLVQLGKILKLDMTYAQKFSRVFLNLLKRRMNSYPPPELQEECETL
uniref:VWFA domain-containing protein n=1 Tax=Pelodiscus sinensis TaxID=13735 RepID=K7GEE6_PELSI